MIAYVKSHWYGELSLTRSYWVNGILLSITFGIGGRLLEQPLSEQPPEHAAIIGLALVVLTAVITLWQFVGVWRSATNTSIKTGHAFCPGR